MKFVLTSSFRTISLQSLKSHPLLHILLSPTNPQLSKVEKPHPLKKPHNCSTGILNQLEPLSAPTLRGLQTKKSQALWAKTHLCAPPDCSHFALKTLTPHQPPHPPGGERRRDEPSARPLMPPDTVQMDSRTVQRRSFASFSAADEMNNEWISVLTTDGDYAALQRTQISLAH